MRRAEAYHAAGSDGILIHSALSTPNEILAFKHEWGDRSPVLIVPTKYYSTPTEVLREAGFSIAIWANHLLRAALPAMQRCAETLMREQNLLSIENDVAPVKEIFRLQGASELQDAEARYLPQKNREARAIIMAASRGGALGDLTSKRPKTMVEVRGQPLLAHIVGAYNDAGLRNITVVRGYLPDTVNLPALRYVDNTDYASTGELQSLACALEADSSDEDELYVSFGDVLFKRYILDVVAEPEDDFVIVVDTNWQGSVNLGRAADYVSCTEPHSRHAYYHEVYLEEAGETLADATRHGEWIGLLRVSKAGMPVLRDAVAELTAAPGNRQAKMYALLNELVRRGHRPRVVYTTGHWLDIDSLDDVLAASTFA
jgi:phosphoenolpyruvate phosphomutase